MTFELESEGVRVWCSSPFWTRKLVEKGVRLVDASQAAYLEGDLAAPEPGLPQPRAESGTRD